MDGDSLRSNLSWTARSAAKAYSAAGQAASALHAMAILQVHQAKALKQVHEGSTDPGLMQELRTRRGAIWCRDPEKGGPSSEECAREVLSRGMSSGNQVRVGPMGCNQQDLLLVLPELAQCLCE